MSHRFAFTVLVAVFVGAFSAATIVGWVYRSVTPAMAQVMEQHPPLLQ